MIAFLDLQRYRDTLIANLPYGVRKVVELGRALCTEPKLLLLDEPSSGLNVEETEGMGFWIEDIKKDLGITVIMVEHDMALVSQVSDRVMALNYGKVLAHGHAARGANAIPKWCAPISAARLRWRHDRTAASRRRDRNLLRPDPGHSRRSLEVAPRQIVTVLGANGAGKTTVLRTVSGILDPEARQGACSRARTSPTWPPDQVMRMGICHVPEGREIFPFLTVRENLMMGAYTRRDSDGVAARSGAVLQLFPAAAGASAPARRLAVGRRTADAGDQPGA